MADICIFYSEPDKDKVETLSSTLMDLGWSVWWDKEIKKGRWATKTERNIGITRCVIPIWNSHAARKDSITFAETDKARTLHKPMITLVSENIEPPLPFNSEHITADISGWDGSNDSDCIGQIIESVESVLGIAPKKWRGERPTIINLLGKQLKLPCFIKSLSSHETQLKPDAGLRILDMFPDVDALLVSAYDMYDKGSDATSEETETYNYMCEKLESLNEKGALILLDSGNYEKSRKNDDKWTSKEFNSVLRNTTYTYSFCFDNLEPLKDPVENVEDVIARIEGEYEDFLLPILHAPKDKSGKRLDKMLPEIFFEYASRKNSPLIAVPERELGEGICEKAKTIIEIRERLNKLDRYQPIHILGTGNPLSLLILAAAGADLFDGLEWCRTVVDRNTGFLFHHQQFDLFRTQTIEMARHEIVREAMTKDDSSLSFKMGLHNLDFFFDWMEELQSSIHSNRVSEMIKFRLIFSTRELVDEMKKLMPGLL